MNIQRDYDRWAATYDTDANRTRDLEMVAGQMLLQDKHFPRTLEIGCGTGKNTEWLRKLSDRIVAVDFSEQMLSKARQKFAGTDISFVHADILQEWDFANGHFDLITFSLILEHIADLGPVFEKAARVLNKGGFIYIGELHPFKQYSGSKARFGDEQSTELTAYTHHVSDFTEAARLSGLRVERICEHFDEENKEGIPRILSLLFRRP